jgi:hypothetical protein
MPLLGFMSNDGNVTAEDLESTNECQEICFKATANDTNTKRGAVGCFVSTDVKVFQYQYSDCSSVTAGGVNFGQGQVRLCNTVPSVSFHNLVRSLVISNSLDPQFYLLNIVF